MALRRVITKIIGCSLIMLAGGIVSDPRVLNFGNYGYVITSTLAGLYLVWPRYR